MERPKIKAEFVLDPEGKPIAQSTGDYRHYKIKLHVEGIPDDAYKVTYQLHPTYYDPLRTTTDRGSGFTEELTSYGDYVLQAKIRTKEYSIGATQGLYEALEETHGDSPDVSVQKALADIKGN